MADNYSSDHLLDDLKIIERKDWIQLNLKSTKDDQMLVTMLTAKEFKELTTAYQNENNEL